MERFTQVGGSDPESFREMMDLFLGQMGGEMQELRAAIQAGKAAQTARLAHRCYGASATCGLIGIFPAARAGADGKGRRVDGALEFWTQADHTLNRIRQVFERQLASLADRPSATDSSLVTSTPTSRNAGDDVRVSGIFHRGFDRRVDQKSVSSPTPPVGT